MKIPTTEAARQLSIHPAHLFQHVAVLERSLTFEDVWPDIDDGWVETVAATGGHKRTTPQAETPGPEQSATSSRLSDDAVHVLDKLSRQGKWGNVSVAFDALQNLTHVPKRDLEDAVDELRKAGFLSHDGTGRGTISLAPGKRREIEQIAQQTAAAYGLPPAAEP